MMVMAAINTIKQGEKQKQVQNNDEWYTYRVDIEVLTPLIAPSLPPNKFMKKLELQDVLRCYSDDAKELAEHLDRVFIRDAECNALLPGHIFTSVLRDVINKNIIVRGEVIVPRDKIRIGVSKILYPQSSLLIYEYIPPGVKVSTTFQVNMPIKEKTIIVAIGMRRYKGFGKLRLSFMPDLK